MGALAVVTNGQDAGALARTMGQLRLLVRQTYSNPPQHGARIVANVLGNPALNAEWRSNVRTMANRILVRPLPVRPSPFTSSSTARASCSSCGACCSSGSARSARRACGTTSSSRPACSPTRASAVRSPRHSPPESSLILVLIART